MPGSAAPDRIAALDLVRGIAVLGILTINVAAFAGGSSAVLSPGLHGPASATDAVTFTAGLILFEGKMRGLFTLLFGASMLLFVDRRDAAGEDGGLRQLRRLGWLLLIGYAHQLLLWSGDILMLYAMVAPLALALRHLPVRRLIVLALAFFMLWHGAFTLTGWSSFTAVEAVRAGTADPQTRAAVLAQADAIAGEARNEVAILLQPYPTMLAERFGDSLTLPFLVTLLSLGETVPLMLLGMALYRSGFFTGGWPRRWLWQLAAASLALGLPLALIQSWWAWSRGFPPEAMFELLIGPAGPQHLALTLAWAALLVLAAPALLRTWLGERLRAAGRMALSNYLLTSLVMAFCFFGWGLGLAGQVGAAQQWWFVLLGWAVMLAWSKPWLARFRQGPAEWLWRSLTEARYVPFKRLL
ncbi:DUF418 domain-containing protein [Novosphingobium ginsenosidimutans]|uniref:DUF418 domain-containing protein n=1 Tax=Novosphingobium ginsenosidimutans TaxID=1176536 RepID=A0A5B8S713_9SPHN|nr:DUF418 domain-containing protein [Novosphingobium ginsenosidimutans]QEA16225.1 DUF418 domain-containing protein [Novosphingobium ginsenosidimutans]